MRETEKRIKAYRAMLPRMRERVIAAISLLAIALATMTSATYAWLVLSQAPEVKGLQTTLAANGNLEIALATGATITVPTNSLVGDGAKDLVAKNITWGNLVNLGDPAYGLENIVLRPASLNTNSLLESPLYAAKYGEDGRVETFTDKFRYACWDKNERIFNADPLAMKYGVRAVSSVIYGSSETEDVALENAKDAASAAIKNAKSHLQGLTESEDLKSLVDLMGACIAAKREGEDDEVTVSTTQLEAICNLYAGLIENVTISADALAAIYNVQMQLRSKDRAYVADNKFTGADLLDKTESEIRNKLKATNEIGELLVEPAMLDYLWQLKKDYNQLLKDKDTLSSYKTETKVVYMNVGDNTYPAIYNEINRIAEVNSSTLNNTRIDQLNASSLLSLVLGGGSKTVVVNNGIIQRMDKFTGANVKATISGVKVMGISMTAVVSTSAKSPFVLDAEYENAKDGDTSFNGSTPMAADTFGLALDFWVRTNASNSQLILQGAPVYETRQENVTITVDGNVYVLYTVTAMVDGTPVSNTAYEKSGTYYYYDRETSTPGDALGAASTFDSIEPVKEDVTVIVGYNGVNRVWDEDGSIYLDEYSTTIGSGSCYVFYPQSPEDQEKTLQLLTNLKIAFIDQEGHLLGRAEMDTANAFAEPGKVTVPVVCAITNSSTTDSDGKSVYYITDLEANTPTFVTALLYLDGQKLTNDQVLAAADIQGHLNLQFGTTADLSALRDPELEQEKCVVTATMSGNTSASIDSPAAELTKTVTVLVDGYEPQSVVAYFQREISSTQGIRQGKMTFTPNGDGSWTASYPFTAAGKYILREVQLDGVTYELDQEPLVFTVEGFTISDINCEHNGKTFMSVDRYFETSVSLTFSTDEIDKMPTSVKGAFIHTETKNRTTVYFTRKMGSTWTGTATFVTSGEYRMEYLELDGQYTGLSEDSYISINLMLGLTANVYASGTKFGLEDGQSHALPVSLIIRDDSGESIGNLGNVWLQYASSGSDVQEDGVGAGMVWNSDRQRYEGTFRVTQTGTYTYHYVSVKLGDDLNYLYRAASAPTINAISDKPVTYVSKDGFGGEVFSLSGDASFTIRLKNAGSATVDAMLSRSDGVARSTEYYYVRGVMTKEGNEQIFTFTIPVVEGTQSGTWKLEALYLTNVLNGATNTMIQASDDDGPLPAGHAGLGNRAPYTVEPDYHDGWLMWSDEDIKNEGEDNTLEIKISSEMTITFPVDDPSNKDREFNGVFGENHSLKDDTLKLQETSGGKPVDEYKKISSIKVVYEYDQTASFEPNFTSNTSYNRFGQYTVATSDIVNYLVTGSRKTIEYTASLDHEDGIYTLSTKNEGLSVAGQYRAVNIVLTFVGEENQPYQFDAETRKKILDTAPIYTVKSAKPVATITGISPTGSNPTKVTWTGSSTPTFTVGDDKVSEYTAERATVYAVATADNSTQHHGSFTQPTLSITLSGMGKASSASLVLPAGDASAITYTYTSDGKVTKTLGSLSEIKKWSGCLTHTLKAYRGHGTQTISQVMMVSNGATCTFVLDTYLTITNPSSVNQTS